MATLRNISFIAAIAFFCIIALFTNVVVAEEDSDIVTKFDYGIMIDAGSSGTRTFLYKWKHRQADVEDDFSPLSHPITQTGWSSKSSIALSDYATNPEKVSDLLNGCMEFAKAKLAEEKVDAKDFDTIPIYLGATAGLRLLTRQQRIDLMLATRAAFHAGPFFFKDHFAKVLSGEEEGFFGYLTVNYLNNTFFPETPNTPFNATLFGALDMGGASTQISFQTSPGEDVMEHYYSYTSPFNDRYELYTVSFLQFGANEFHDRLIAAIFKSSQSTAPVLSPCHQLGFSGAFTIEGVEYTFQGTGQTTECTTIVKSLMYPNTPCLTDYCTVNGAYQPQLPQDITFFAFSGFYNVIPGYSDRNQTEPNAAYYSIDEIESITQRICGMGYEEFDSTYSNVPAQFRSRGCLSLVYQTQLLSLYGFQPTKKNLYVANSIQNTELSWTLGRMVYEVNSLNYERLAKKQPSRVTFFVAFAVIAGALFFVLVLLYRTWKALSIARSDKIGALTVVNDNNNDQYHSMI